MFQNSNLARPGVFGAAAQQTSAALYIPQLICICCCLPHVRTANFNEQPHRPVEIIKNMPNSSSDASSGSSNSAPMINQDLSGLEDLACALDFATPPKQEARSFLRERFLRVITGIVGKPAKFQLYENTTVNAEFRGCDIDFLELYVRKLSTPLGTIPEAILRTNDVILMEMEQV